MELLLYANVDEKGCFARFDSEVTEDSLVDILNEYYDEDVSKSAAAELISSGVYDMGDAASTTLEIVSL